MQIVQHGRVPFEHSCGDVLREVEGLAHAVAVVVVRDVFAPVHHRGLGLAGLLTVVVGVHLLVAAIGFHHRRDEDDGVFADLLNKRRFFDDEPVGKLDQHLRAAGLGRVDAAGDPIDGL